MQHFGASLPHLAMALADLHLARGGDDPLFVKGQVGGWEMRGARWPPAPPGALGAEARGGSV